MNKKDTVLNVDIIKGIGIILVMIGHSGMFLIIKENAFLSTFIYSFHMPLFFIIAGFFMKDNVNLKKSVKRLLIPFLISFHILGFCCVLFSSITDFF
jgi:fucose 4-O-acetylase-like acetyltransferase